MRDDLHRYRAIRHALTQGALTPTRTAMTPATCAPWHPLQQASIIVSTIPSGFCAQPTHLTTARPGRARTPTVTLRGRLRLR